LGIGEGSEMMQPLAIAVVGGLSVSMLLTLFVVPSAYLIFNTAAERLGAFVTGRGGKPEAVPAEVGAD
jgi:predicted RND superfamily exporter protein